MKLWLVHSEEVSLREQIVRQVTLAVLSGELSAGERLPSVREVARRFHVHPNTVSAAYRQLGVEGWTAVRRGSGIYVSTCKGVNGRPVQQTSSLDTLLSRVVQNAAEAGLGDAEVHRRLAQALARRGRLLLMEPDPELAKLVQYECVNAGCNSFPASSLPVDRWETEMKTAVDGWMAAVLPSKAAAARVVLGPDASLFVFQIGPIASALAANLPVSRDHLVAIASAWPQFLEVTRTLLVATGFSADALLVRDARVPGWERGLVDAAAVICDTLTAKRLPVDVTALVFPLIAETSLEELRKMGQNTGHIE